MQRFNHDLDAVLGDREMAARLLAITERAGCIEQMNTFLQAEHTR